MDVQREDYLDTERSPQRNHPKQRLTHNVPNEDVENTNGINYRDLPLTDKLQTLLQGTERVQKGD